MLETRQFEIEQSETQKTYHKFLLCVNREVKIVIG